MKLVSSNRRIAIVISSLTLSGLSLTALVKPAQAGFLDGIRDTINGINSTINTVEDIKSQISGTSNNANNLKNGLIGTSNNINNSSKQSGSSNSHHSGAGQGKAIIDITSVLREYSGWVSVMGTAEKNVLKALVPLVAKKKSRVSFGYFQKHSRLSKGEMLLAPDVFYKFDSLYFEADEIRHDREKFMAFAYCLNNGGKTGIDGITCK
jgi:hypothetical protein